MSEPVVLSSKVEAVTVFRAGAVVTRRAPLAGAAWPDEIAIDGLPLSMLDDSVRVAVDGTASGLPRPADVRVVFVVPKVGESIVAPSDQERIAAQDAVERIQQRIARVDAE